MVIFFNDGYTVFVTATLSHDGYNVIVSVTLSYYGYNVFVADFFVTVIPFEDGYNVL